VGSKKALRGAVCALERVCGPAHSEAGPTPLYEAAFKGHAEVAKLLIEKGANVNRAYVPRP